MKNNSVNKDSKKQPVLIIMLIFWTGAGTAIGTAYGSVGLGTALGAGLGLTIGLIFDRQKKKDE